MAAYDRAAGPGRSLRPRVPVVAARRALNGLTFQKQARSEGNQAASQRARISSSPVSETLESVRGLAKFCRLDYVAAPVIMR